MFTCFILSMVNSAALIVSFLSPKRNPSTFPLPIDSGFHHSFRLFEDIDSVPLRGSKLGTELDLPNQPVKPARARAGPWGIHTLNRLYTDANLGS